MDGAENGLSVILQSVQEIEDSPGGLRTKSTGDGRENMISRQSLRGRGN
jgi:hypothetical protein